MTYSGAISRVPDVFALFARGGGALTSTQIAIGLDLPRGDGERLVENLQREGYLVRDPTGQLYEPAEEMRGAGDWVRPLCQFDQFVAGCACRLYSEFGLPTAVSHREGLYVDWDMTLGVPNLAPGSRLPALRTVNGIVSLSLADSATTLRLISAHNDRFDRAEQVRAFEVIDRVNVVRGRDYGAFPAPLFPGDQTICFSVRDERAMQERLLSVVVKARDRAELEPQVVRYIRRMLEQDQAGARSASPGRAG